MIEPLAKRSSDEMAPGTSCLALTMIKSFCRQKFIGILSFFGLLHVAGYKQIFLDILLLLRYNYEQRKRKIRSRRIRKRRYPMYLLDIAILAIVVASILYSAWRGAVKEIFAVLSVILGIAGAVYLHGPIGKALGGSDIARAISFVSLFFGVAFVVARIGKSLQTVLRLAFLGGVDRLVGAAIGLVKGVLIVCIILGLATSYIPAARNLLGNTRLSVPTLKVVDLLSPMLPSELRETFETRYEDIKKLGDKARRKGKMLEKGLEQLEELEKKVR
jgi:membrane protein required for colicin V production